ncbi:DUF4132 domain-containing protein [Actinomadura sp. 9N407]|uniref:DUF4132 domain-containing protein n=1 Tax=Actinomadura sp. 9N407 TaxID=3375154 RepID=UPI0037A74869
MSDLARDELARAEDVLVIPEEWRASLSPRRGGVAPVPEVALQVDAVRRVRERLVDSRAAIDAVLDHESSDPGLAGVAQSFLRGEGDVLGAAAVAVADTLVRERSVDGTGTDWVDYLAAEHGLAFAAEVFAEIDGIGVSLTGSSGDWRQSINREGWSTRRAYWARGDAGRRMRGLLAAAADGEYTAAVEALARYRGGERLQRMVVSFLVPTRQDWVDECCDERSPSDYWMSDEPALLWCALGSAAQVERLGLEARFEYGIGFASVLFTSVEGVGAAVAPALAAAFDEEVRVSIGNEAARCRTLLEALGALPSDQAFRLMAERLGQRHVLSAMVEMSERFPVRALRILAELSGGTSERARLAAGLLKMRAQARPELVEMVGDEVKAAIEAVLADGVQEADAGDVPKALRKGGKVTPPGWARAGALPQVLLKGRERALPAEATRHLIEALTKATPRRRPSAAVQEALDDLDPRSLFEFGWALLGLWRAAVEEERAGWAVSQLGWIGGDEGARRLGALARSWSSQEGIRLPLDGLDVLAGMGSDVALIQLHLVRAKARPKRLKNRAGTLLRKTAEARGLTPEQLADRLVPDFGLDAEGSMTLDYGPRTFTVGFDEGLKPFVTDEAGKLRKALPKPGVKDDQELAPAAYAAFAGLKKDVRSVAPEQIHRMERAMVEQRRWEVGDFRRLFAGHPLLWHIVKRLVWIHQDGGADGGGEGGKSTAFRLAEDRTFADADDEVVTLPETGDVWIAHPLHLGEQLRTWGDLFGDYEILQPFPQLGRPVGAFTEKERAANRLDRVEGIVVKTSAVLRLERDGWARGEAGDGGYRIHMDWITSSDHGIVLDLEPGFPAWNPGDYAEQKLGAVWIGRHGSDLRFGELDEVTASELLYTLSTLSEDAL